MNLLEYLVQQIQKSSPSLMDLNDELSHLEAASRVSIADVSNSVKTLANGMDQVKEEISQVRLTMNQKDKQDQFVSRMEMFLRQAEVLMKSTQVQMTHLQREMEELVGYFGQESARLKPEILFGTLARFKLEFEQAIAELNLDDSQDTDSFIDNPLGLHGDNKMNGPLTEEDDKTSHKNNNLPSTPIGQGRVIGGTQSRRRTCVGTGGVIGSAFGKGGLDLAIREIRTGSKLRRPPHFLQREVEDSPTPASRIFLTG
ncbi:hypothetical protein PCANC_07047 [Puccinia coronata f. sp. avenae]|uniref:FH2 domain-containing protein n=1 Tax=Puccinia coronata f. sp. avenae TaxID=200324 RepID=A0A2N5VZS6_9BASI|nr:hypothetical protein PCANC_07047 [Puccinia coronata f. sp. avenae]